MVDSSKYRDSDSQTLVNIDSKLTAYNLKTLAFTDPTTNIGEGVLLGFDSSTDKGRRAVVADGMVMLSYFDTTMTSSKDRQEDPIHGSAGDQVPIQSGGLSGIVGNNLLVGIPSSLWDVARAPVVGDYVMVGTAGTPLAVAPGSISGNIIFGFIYHIEGGSEQRVRMIFSSFGIQY